MRTYLYGYTHPHPVDPDVDNNPDRARRPWNAKEAIFALDNLDSRPPYAWSAEDREISRMFSGHIEQFVKDGNPNRQDLPNWPALTRAANGIIPHAIGADTQRVASDNAARHELIKFYFANQEAAEAEFIKSHE